MLTPDKTAVIAAVGMMHSMRSNAVSVLLLGLLIRPSMCAGQQSGDAALKQRLEHIAAGFHGHLTLYAEQLNTGRTVALDADRPVQTASVIKLAILYEAMEEVRSGKLRWDQKLVLAPGDAVSGSGVLAFFDAPLQLTLKDVLSMMIIVSDNTATNLAIDTIGVGPVNARMEAIGLRNTHLYKKVMKPPTEPMPADQLKFGLGKTTAREMATLMARIGLCQLGPESGSSPSLSSTDVAICDVALSMLRNQFYRNTIPRFLEGVDTSETGSAIASKTGSLDAVRNDVAIVAGKEGPMVLSIFTYGNQDTSWTTDNAGERVIADAAREIVRAWSPSGMESKDLRPGLGLKKAGGVASASKRHRLPDVQRKEGTRADD